MASSWDPHLRILLLHTCPSLANHARSLKTPHLLSAPPPDGQLLSRCSDLSFEAPWLWGCLTRALFYRGEFTEICVLVLKNAEKKLISGKKPSATNKCHQLSQPSQMCHHGGVRDMLCWERTWLPPCLVSLRLVSVRLDGRGLPEKVKLSLQHVNCLKPKQNRPRWTAPTSAPISISMLNKHTPDITWCWAAPATIDVTKGKFDCVLIKIADSSEKETRQTIAPMRISRKLK